MLSVPSAPLEPVALMAEALRACEADAGAPLFGRVGLVSLIGLVGALLQDGVWDWAFAALLASPILATGWAVVRSRS